MVPSWSISITEVLELPTYFDIRVTYIVLSNINIIDLNYCLISKERFFKNMYTFLYFVKIKTETMAKRYNVIKRLGAD